MLHSVRRYSTVADRSVIFSLSRRYRYGRLAGPSIAPAGPRGSDSCRIDLQTAAIGGDGSSCARWARTALRSPEERESTPLRRCRRRRQLVVIFSACRSRQRDADVARAQLRQEDADCLLRNRQMKVLRCERHGRSSCASRRRAGRDVSVHRRARHFELERGSFDMNVVHAVEVRLEPRGSRRAGRGVRAAGPSGIRRVPGVRQDRRGAGWSGRSDGCCWAAGPKGERARPVPQVPQVRWCGGSSGSAGSAGSRRASGCAGTDRCLGCSGAPGLPGPAGPRGLRAAGRAGIIDRPRRSRPPGSRPCAHRYSDDHSSVRRCKAGIRRRIRDDSTTGVYSRQLFSRLELSRPASSMAGV